LAQDLELADLGKVHFNKGKAFEALKRLEEAKQNYEYCLRIDENDSRAMMNLALILDQLGDTEGGIKLLQQALAVT